MTENLRDLLTADGRQWKEEKYMIMLKGASVYLSAEYNCSHWKVEAEGHDGGEATLELMAMGGTRYGILEIAVNMEIIEENGYGQSPFSPESSYSDLDESDTKRIRLQDQRFKQIAYLKQSMTHSPKDHSFLFNLAPYLELQPPDRLLMLRNASQSFQIFITLHSTTSDSVASRRPPSLFPIKSASYRLMDSSCIRVSKEVLSLHSSVFLSHFYKQNTDTYIEKRPSREEMMELLLFMRTKEINFNQLRRLVYLAVNFNMVNLMTSIVRHLQLRANSASGRDVLLYADVFDNGLMSRLIDRVDNASSLLEWIEPILDKLSSVAVKMIVNRVIIMNKKIARDKRVIERKLNRPRLWLEAREGTVMIELFSDLSPQYATAIRDVFLKKGNMPSVEDWLLADDSVPIVCLSLSSPLVVNKDECILKVDSCDGWMLGYLSRDSLCFFKCDSMPTRKSLRPLGKVFYGSQFLSTLSRIVDYGVCAE